MDVYMKKDFIFRRIFPVGDTLDLLNSNLKEPVKTPALNGKKISNCDEKTKVLQARLNKPVPSQNLSLVRRKNKIS